MIAPAAGPNSTVLVTGGAGFIGSAVVRKLVGQTEHRVVTLDKLTYAGNELNLAECLQSPRHHFVRGDIVDRDLVRSTLADFDVRVVLHLAAESHVDRSIDSPAVFLQTNVIGTFVLLEEFRNHVSQVGSDAGACRFCQVSTDEVFGSLGPDGSFSETSPYDPSSPYSASKAAADHLARAWGKTYGLPVIVTNCSNNYGPYQFPEKLIPLMILNCLEGKPLPIYGDGSNVRDWLFVDDHAEALYRIACLGRPGETYNVGSRSERSNLEVAMAICDIFDRLRPARWPHQELIRFVEDRPGHDLRYSIDPSKVETELGWTAKWQLERGLEKTVTWYLNNLDWCNSVQSDYNARQRRGLRAPEPKAAV